MEDHRGEPAYRKTGSRECAPWFEETDGGTIELGASDLRPAPPGAKDSPLGTKDGMIGWKSVKRGDGSYFGMGIDGRRWDKPLIQPDGTDALPVALLRQPGTSEFLPVTTSGPRMANYWIWDPGGSTVVATVQDFEGDDDDGRATVLPLQFWHFLRARHQASSQKLRGVSHAECAALLKAAAADRAGARRAARRRQKSGRKEEPALRPEEATA